MPRHEDSNADSGGSEDGSSGSDDSGVERRAEQWHWAEDNDDARADGNADVLSSRHSPAVGDSPYGAFDGGRGAVKAGRKAGLAALGSHRSWQGGRVLLGPRPPSQGVHQRGGQFVIESTGWPDPSIGVVHVLAEGAEATSGLALRRSARWSGPTDAAAVEAEHAEARGQQCRLWGQRGRILGLGRLGR